MIQTSDCSSVCPLLEYTELKGSVLKMSRAETYNVSFFSLFMVVNLRFINPVDKFNQIFQNNFKAIYIPLMNQEGLSMDSHVVFSVGRIHHEITFPA